MRRTEGLDASLRQNRRILQDVFRLDLTFYTSAHDLLEVLLEILADNEHHLVKARLDGVANRQIQQETPVVRYGRHLL